MRLGSLSQIYRVAIPIIIIIRDQRRAPKEAGITTTNIDLHRPVVARIATVLGPLLSSWDENPLAFPLSLLPFPLTPLFLISSFFHLSPILSPLLIPWFISFILPTILFHFLPLSSLLPLIITPLPCLPSFCLPHPSSPSICHLHMRKDFVLEI